MAVVAMTAAARVPRPFDATLYEELRLLMEMGLVGQLVFNELPSSWPLLLKSSDPPVTPPLPLKLISPTSPNLPPPTAAAVFWMEEPPKAKFPLSVAFEKEPLCLRIKPLVNGPVVSKSITCPVEATAGVPEMFPSEKR